MSVDEEEEVNYNVLEEANNVKLLFTKEENRLFEVLIRASEKVDVPIRVAGGWVRDKVLQSVELSSRPANSPNNGNNDNNGSIGAGAADDDDDIIISSCSNDIDIALGGMKGVEFATLVREYLLSHSDDSDDSDKARTHKIGVISANPAQSKHLETATMSIFGLDVDFCNLRADEIYADEHSRVPTSTNPYGTPRQDALRRDFTVNALFYNLRTRRVEDYTRRGFRDLVELRLLRTPLDARVTLTDDPLRVLRGVRFAVRYELRWDECLWKAASSSVTRRALESKVSRERVGKELEGMLSGKRARPERALKLLYDLNLCPAVFGKWPGNNNNSDSDDDGDGDDDENMEEEDHQSLWQKAPLYLALLTNQVLPAFQTHIIHKSADAANNLNNPNNLNNDYRMLYISTFLLPFFHLTYLDKKNKIVPVVQYLLKEGIKFKNADAHTISNYVAHLPALVSLVRTLPTTMVNNDNDANPLHKDRLHSYRIEVGQLLRKLKDQWVSCLMLAAVQQQQQSDDSSTRFLNAALAFYDAVNSTTNLALSNCWTWKPVLNGGRISRLLQLPQGPIVGVYGEEHRRHLWSRGGHDVPNVAECEAWLLRVQEQRRASGLEKEDDEDCCLRGNKKNNNYTQKKREREKETKS